VGTDPGFGIAAKEVGAATFYIDKDFPDLNEKAEPS